MSSLGARGPRVGCSDGAAAIRRPCLHWINRNGQCRCVRSISQFFYFYKIEFLNVFEFSREPQIRSLERSGPTDLPQTCFKLVCSTCVAVSAAAPSPRATVLEMGGSDPFYVAADVKLPSAAQQLAEGKFTMNGENCDAPERIFVNETIYDQFAQVLIHATVAVCLVP